MGGRKISNVTSEYSIEINVNPMQDRYFLLIKYSNIIYFSFQARSRTA